MTTKISAGIVATANDRMDVWEPGYLIVRDGLIAEAGPATARTAPSTKLLRPAGSSCQAWSTATRIRRRTCSRDHGPSFRWKSGVSTSAPDGANIPTKRSM